ncbi:phospholipase A2-like [Anopheles darlingi]|uniref:phospholipase A2-like n=1 Tax=Anopheles darlingi TaxID=43151 RepID=UPI00210013BD|nr:phospholipase A2-like [Anopheles darlingi]
MVEEYNLLNNSDDEPWSNPHHAGYDLQLIEDIQNHLKNSVQDQQQLQDDSTSSMHGGLRLITKYCGPGNWSTNGETVQHEYFASTDICCKHHDECPDTITNRGDYQRYENLPYKAQFFTKLRCSCDVEFLQCLRNVSTFFSYAIAWIYTKVQSHCFEREYPAIKCVSKRNDGLLSSDRCLTYKVDNSKSRQWQWFDIPYIGANHMYFPEVEYRYEHDWFNILFGAIATEPTQS